MGEIVTAALPIYLIVALGYVAAKTRYLSRDLLTRMAEVTVKVTLPVLVFQAIARARPGAINESFLLAYGLGSLAALAVGVMAARLFLRRPAQEAWILGWGASNSNSGFLGLPLGLSLFGPDAVLVFAMTMIVENAFLIPLVLTAATMAGAGGGLAAATRAFGNVLRNPLILSILAGLAARGLGLTIPQPLWRTLDLLSAAAPGVALLVIGAILAGLSMQGYWRRVGLVALGKLVVHPLLVLVALMLVPGVPPDLLVIGVVFASLPMLTVYPLLSQPFGMAGVASAALFVTTLLGSVTVAVVLALVLG